MAEMHLCPSDQLRAYVRQVALAMGAAGDIADELANHLVKANLSGHDSHGVLRLPQYVQQADTGGLVPNARPEVVREMGGTAVMDAHFGFGQYSTAVALDWAMERAHTQGIAAVACRHATHIGRLGEYTERASAAGMIAIVTIGTAAPNSGGACPSMGRAASSARTRGPLASRRTARRTWSTTPRPRRSRRGSCASPAPRMPPSRRG